MGKPESKEQKPLTHALDTLIREAFICQAVQKDAEEAGKKYKSELMPMMLGQKLVDTVDGGSVTHDFGTVTYCVGRDIYEADLDCLEKLISKGKITVRQVLELVSTFDVEKAKTALDPAQHTAVFKRQKPVADKPGAPFLRLNPTNKDAIRAAIFEEKMMPLLSESNAKAALKVNLRQDKINKARELQKVLETPTPVKKGKEKAASRAVK